MHFQREDDFMKEYITKFSDKSYLLKPFEFTKFNDEPEKGYDPNKIAYYDTHDLTFVKEAKTRGNRGQGESKTKCCQTITSVDEYINSKTEIYHINSLKIKLNKLGIIPDEDIRKIEMLKSSIVLK